MTGEIIKQFLISLGFEVDDQSLTQFTKQIAIATVKVAALATSIEATAAIIAKGITGISEDFEEIGYAYRIITPAINKAILLRQELFKAYNAAGINITQAVVASYKLNLSLTKTKFALDAIYKSVGSRFFTFLTKESDLFRNKIYANMPKIQATLESLVRFIFKMLEGIIQLGTTLWSILSRVYEFFVSLDKATDGWSTKILAAIAIWKLLNLSFLATPLGLLFLLSTTLLALYDDFKVFVEGGKSLINWNSEFTKSIVGIVAIVSGAVSIFYLAVAAVKAWGVAMTVWNNIARIMTGLIWAIDAAMAANPVALITAGVLALVAALVLLYQKWDAVKRAFHEGLPSLSSIGGSILNFLGGPGAHFAPNAANAVNTFGPKEEFGPAGGVPPSGSKDQPGGVTPLGSNTSNRTNTNNVNLQSQTTINTQPGADANTIGKISSDSTKQVFDMVRNLGLGAIGIGGTP